MTNFVVEQVLDEAEAFLWGKTKDGIHADAEVTVFRYDGVIGTKTSKFARKGHRERGEVGLGEAGGGQDFGVVDHAVEHPVVADLPRGAREADVVIERTFEECGAKGIAIDLKDFSPGVGF